MARNVIGPREKPTTIGIKKKKWGRTQNWLGWEAGEDLRRAEGGSRYSQNALFKILEELKTEKDLKYFYVLLNIFYYSAKCRYNIKLTQNHPSRRFGTSSHPHPHLFAVGEC